MTSVMRAREVRQLPFLDGVSRSPGSVPSLMSGGTLHHARAFVSTTLLLAAGLSLVAVPVVPQPNYDNFECGEGFTPDG